METHPDHGAGMAAGEFPRDPSGLPAATRPEVLELADRDTLDLRVGPVAKRLGDTTVRMLAGVLTLIDVDGREHGVAERERYVDAADLAAATGWTLKPAGLCRDEVRASAEGSTPSRPSENR